MLAIARADDTRQVVIDEEGTRITVPDIKMPAGVEWSASQIPGQQAVFITFATDKAEATTLWHGPYSIGPGTYYVIDAPRRVLAALRNQLGAGNVMPLVRALRASAGLRGWAKAQGFSLIRNSAGNPVGIYPPLVICGSSPIDLDGDELDMAAELTELEGV